MARKINVVASEEEYVWIVRNKKQQGVQDPDPVQAMKEFAKLYGTRGEIRLTRWARTGGDMLTSTGVHFKGTFKSVVEQLEQYTKTASAANTFGQNDQYGESLADGEKVAKGGMSLTGNAVLGDLKRIQSLIRTWSSKKGKGAPDPEQLKEYISYQHDIAGYIAKTWIRKLPENYQKKAEAI